MNATDWLHRMTADRAKEQNGPASLAVDSMNARLAHDFVAMGAPMGDTRLRVTRADKGSIRHNDGRSREFPVNKFGNRHPKLGAFDGQFDVAQADNLAGGQSGFSNTSSIHERAVCGLQIAYRHAFLQQHHFTVKARYGRMGDGEVRIRTAANAIRPQFQLDQPVFYPIRFD
ncbi:MAG: hypothetical protein ABSA69_04975 [Verrucomicrobiota bacterium]